MSVKVAVRVRPLNTRERQAGSKPVVSMQGHQTWLYPKDGHTTSAMGTKLEEGTKKFTFDHSFWSCSASDGNYASQEMVFDTLGKPLLDSVFKGYNTCLFAYGQTSAGKSYSMMGEDDNPGLIPRVSQALFDQVVRQGGGEGGEASFKAVVSYLEIYNERVRDLLVKSNATALKAWTSNKDQTASLKVREHPKTGPYVEGLSQHSVTTVQDIMKLIECGNNNRTTAATLMNGLSSRSHSIFTINFSQATMRDGIPCEMSSRINLVDLAGSERVQSSGATGERLKEGANINKSLTTLGLVISNLASNSSAESSTNPIKQKVKAFVPYRDSVLTWLLKDSLGGNAMTIMLAAISPADINYGETLSTLRYAHRAKSIVNKPTVNEDANVKLIRELRAEISLLRQQLGGNFMQAESAVSVALQSKLQQSELLAASLTQNWEAKWEKTHKIIQERSLALTDSGATLHVESEQPYLIALAVDRLSTGVTICNLKEGITTFGTNTDNHHPDITLAGPNVLSNHCHVENKGNAVTLYPGDGALCLVDNFTVHEPTVLTQGCMIQLAAQNLFRYNNPAEAAQLQSCGGEHRQSVMLDVVGVLSKSRSPSVYSHRDSPSSSLGSDSDEDMSALMRSRKKTIGNAQNQLLLEKDVARKATEEAERVKMELEKLRLDMSKKQNEQDEELRSQLLREQHEAKVAEEAAKKANEELQNLKSFIQQQRKEFELIRQQELKGAQEKAQEEAARKAREELEMLRRQLTTTQEQERTLLQDRLEKEHSEARAAQLSAAAAAKELEQLREQLTSKRQEAETMKGEIDRRQSQATEAAAQAQAALVELNRVRNDFASKEQSESLYQKRLEEEQIEARRAAQRAEEARTQFSQMQEEFNRKAMDEERLREQYRKEQEEANKAAEAASKAEAELERMRQFYEKQLEEERERLAAKALADEESRQAELERSKAEEERQRQELAKRQHEIELLRSRLDVVTEESTQQQKVHSEQLKQRELQERERLQKQEKERLAKEAELKEQVQLLETKNRRQEEDRRRSLHIVAAGQTPLVQNSSLGVSGFETSFTAGPAAFGRSQSMRSPPQTPVQSTGGSLTVSPSMDEFDGFAKARASSMSPVINGCLVESPPATPSSIGQSTPVSLLALSSSGTQLDPVRQAAVPSSPAGVDQRHNIVYKTQRQSDLMAFSIPNTNSTSSTLSGVDEFDPLATKPAAQTPSQPPLQPHSQPQAQQPAAPALRAGTTASNNLVPSQQSIAAQPSSPASKVAPTAVQQEVSPIVLSEKQAAQRHALEEEMRRQAEATIRQLAADHKEKLRGELQAERQQMTEELSRRERQVEEDRRALREASLRQQTASLTRTPKKGDCDLKLYLTVERGHNLEVTRKVEITADNTCTGYMVKQGGRFKSWKKRFFVLNPQRRMLSYYTDHFMRECKGSMYFDAFQRVYGSNAEQGKTAQEYLRPQAPGTEVWVIYIQTNERLYLAKPPCGPSYAIWLDALQVCTWR